MKATTIRPKKGKNPEYSAVDQAAAKKAGLPYRVKPLTDIPVGTVIEHQEAWVLVEIGDALPADEECRAAIVMTDDELVGVIARQELINQGRSTGVPDVDGPRKESSVRLPDEWSHLADAVAAKIEKRQSRIDELHNVSKQEEAEEKAEGQIMYVVNANDLPPEEDDLPPEE